MDEQKISSVLKDLGSGALVELTLIIAAAGVLIFAVEKVLPWLANRLRGKRRHVLLAMVPLLRLLIVLAAFLLIVPIVIEPSLQNMVAVLGSIGLALGFALKDYASSLVAGIIAIGEAPYRTGDWVKISGIYGEVKHVGMRALQLVTPDDDLVTIPHLTLWTEPVSNANNGGPQLQCTADFYLHPEHDGDRARAALEDVALTSPYLAIGRSISVIANEDPWSTRYRIRAYPIEARQQFSFVTDLTVRGKAELMRLGMPFAVVPASREEVAPAAEP
jgi:small-conductance mechanosensitive channel